MATERETLSVVAAILLGTLDSVKHTADAVALAADIMIDADAYLLRRKKATEISPWISEAGAEQ